MIVFSLSLREEAKTVDGVGDPGHHAIGDRILGTAGLAVRRAALKRTNHYKEVRYEGCERDGMFLHV